MNTPYALDVADAILDLAFKDGIEINHLKLQKLLFLGQGWSLSLKNQVLFKDPIELWQYGPIIRSVCDQLLSTKNKPLTKSLKTKKKLNYNANCIINLLWEAYKDEDTEILSRITHAKDSPWSIIYKYDPTVKVIPNYMMHYYFDQLRQAASENENQTDLT